MDGGQSWRPQDSTVSTNLYDIFFTTARDGIIVGENATILQTSDGGRSWSALSCNDDSVAHADLMGVSVFAVSAGTSYFIVGQQGLLIVSTDGQGETWTVSQLVSDCFDPNSQGCLANSKWTSNTKLPDLLGVRFFDTSNGVVVSKSQNVLITGDGGVSFSVLRPVDLSLFPAAFYSALDFDEACPVPNLSKLHAGRSKCTA
jgi:photosystem II stability/assembly factor-like uncharacterized protein